MIDKKREPGIIENFSSGKEDHGIYTCSIGIGFKSSYQGFGNICLDEKLLFHFKNEVCKIFKVKTTKELIGKECFALRCFGDWGDTIEGLENPLNGKRFIIRNWCLKYIPDYKDESPLERRRKHCLSRIESAYRQISSAEKELQTIDSNYTEWI